MTVDGRTDRPRADMLLLVATSAVHLLFEDLLHAKGVFLLLAAVVWVWWLFRRTREQPGLFHDWGFSTSHLRPALAAAAAVAAAGALVLLGLGHLLGHRVPPGHFWAVVGLYMGWALVQQAALNGILVRGLVSLMPRWSVPLAAGALFSLAHFPDLSLMALTFLGGLIWAVLYLRWPNLWPLVLCHALLGALAYYTVLGRDPWVELLPP